MDKEKILEVNNLNIDYIFENKPINLIKDFGFTLHKGEVIGVVGESGSGKTLSSMALLKLISPKLKYRSGNAYFHNDSDEKIDLLKLNDRELEKYRGKDFGVIFQEPMTSLNPAFICGSQITERITRHLKYNKKEAKDYTLSLLEDVKIQNPSKVFNSYPHQISGGQQQRIMIAMAISCNPKILIADEPTTALDVTVQRSIIELIQTIISKNNLSVIFISHDLSIISELVSDVIVMYKGAIVEKNSINKIFYYPQNPYTKALIACRPNNNNQNEYLNTIDDFFYTDKEGNIIQKEITKKTAFIQKHNVSDKPLIDIKNLNVSYKINSSFFSKEKKYFQVLNNLNFSIFKGETLGIVGESGCGKSTLAKTIVKLVMPTSGSIHFDDKNITDLSNREFRQYRSKIQIIFQDPYSSLNPYLKIGTALKEVIDVYTDERSNIKKKNKVIEMLETVGLKEMHYDRYSHEFSGGQRQRICIARALLLNPEFLILDESVSALDVSVQAQVLNLLNNLKQDFNLTYAFISHDMSVIKYMSDRVIVMNKGIIEEIGNVKQVYENPIAEYTKMLINAANFKIKEH